MRTGGRQRIYAAARLLVNFLQPLFKLKKKSALRVEDHKALSSSRHTSRTCAETSETSVRN
jgi:hypothetical protein